VEKTDLAPRTVRYALKKLVGDGHVVRVPNLEDLRQTLFLLGRDIERYNHSVAQKGGVYIERIRKRII
jgi:DNA-binding MarR family transcriptional regulator